MASASNPLNFLQVVNLKDLSPTEYVPLETLSFKMLLSSVEQVKITISEIFEFSNSLIDLLMNFQSIH